MSRDPSGHSIAPRDCDWDSEHGFARKTVFVENLDTFVIKLVQLAQLLEHQ